MADGTTTPNSTENTDESEIYFAARRLEKNFAGAVLEKKKIHEMFVEQVGLTNLWRKMHWRYYGVDPDTGWSDQEVGRSGTEGELHLLMLNHMRADIQLWLNLAANQRVAMEPRAKVDDYAGQLAVKRGKAVLKSFNRKCKIEELDREAVEYAGVYGAAWMLRLWDPSLGEAVLPAEEAAEPGTEPAEAMREGDLRAFAVTPMDTFFDPFTRGTCPWVIHRIYLNRHDLAAAFPKRAQEILNLSTDPLETTTTRVDLFASGRTMAAGRDARDEVPVLVFLHDDTPAVPGGRHALVLNADIVLDDIPLVARYKKGRPSHRLAPAEIHRSPFGFSPAFGLLAPQEAQSSMSSIQISNIRNFGLGIIISPKGSDVDETDLGDGLKLVEYPAGLEPPRALQMPQTPQEAYVFRKALIDEMGSLIGINSVVRGDPEASLKSGSALALVQSTAVQFSSDFQANIITFRENHFFDTIAIVTQNMDAEFMPAVAGDFESTLLAPFQAEALAALDRIELESVNPLSQTIAGRMELASNLADRYPNQTTPADFLQVAETGSLSELTRGPVQRKAMLSRENEMLAQGIGPKPPPQMGPDGQPLPEAAPAPGVPRRRYVRALVTDDHRAHVKKHLEVLDNPALRDDDSPDAQAVIDAVLGHVEEHRALLEDATLNQLSLLELVDQPPLQSVLPPPMAPGAGGPPPGGPAGDGGAPPPKPEGAGMPESGPPGANQMPKQPKMPVNPATGQRAEEMPGP